MADDNENFIAPSDKTPDRKTPQDGQGNTPAESEWRKLTGEKYKTPEELAKAYKDMETKFGQNSEEVRKAREFAEVINPLLEEIRNDPEIFNKLDEKLRKKGQPNTTPNTPADTKQQSEEMRVVAQQILLDKFEQKRGIDKLTADEQKTMRNKIGETIVKLTGTDMNHVDLRRLNDVLDNAFILANQDTLVDKSKLEAMTSARENDDGSMPSIPTSPGKNGDTLTSEEARVADRLGLSREQYLDGKKGLTKNKK